MSFLLIRHGKSTHNLNGVFAGSRLDTELHPTGIAGLRVFAQKITEFIELDTIISSTLKRSLATALIIQRQQEKIYKKSVPIEQTSLLNEVDFGVLSGLTPSAAANSFPKDYSRSQSLISDDWSFTGGENIQTLISRINQLKEFLKKIKNQNVLLVGHAMFNRLIAEKIGNSPRPDFSHNDLIELDLHYES